MNKFKKWLFRKEIEKYEWMINTLSGDLTDANEYIDLYEEEIDKLERENRMLTMIIESLKLYDNKNN